MLLSKRHSLLGRLANCLAVIAFVLSGSVFTHAKEFTKHHHEPTVFHDSGVANEGYHHHSDAPCEKCSHSHFIHCGANILALIADVEDCIARSCSVGQFRYASLVRTSDTSLDPPPPRTRSLAV